MASAISITPSPPPPISDWIARHGHHIKIIATVILYMCGLFSVIYGVYKIKNGEKRNGTLLFLIGGIIILTAIILYCYLV